MSAASSTPVDRIFHNRHEAGDALVPALRPLAREHPVVVAIPRGGVPVAVAVAHGLHVPLDVAIVFRLVASEDPRLGVGAVAEGDVLVVDRQAVSLIGIGRNELDAVVAHGRRELASRAARYRPACPHAAVEGRAAILVDDGVETGVTAVAAARVLRDRGASRVVLAVPVAPTHLRGELGELIDDLVCTETPDPFYAIDAWYYDFDPVSDAEVVQLLAASHARSQRPAPGLAELNRLRARVPRRPRAPHPLAPLDRTDARAKSSRHGKSTADKWNQ